MLRGKSRIRYESRVTSRERITRRRQSFVASNDITKRSRASERDLATISIHANAFVLPAFPFQPFRPRDRTRRILRTRSATSRASFSPPARILPNRDRNRILRHSDDSVCSAALVNVPFFPLSFRYRLFVSPSFPITYFIRCYPRQSRLPTKRESPLVGLSAPPFLRYTLAE